MDEQSIFLEALQKESPEERAAFLAAACGNDEAVRHEVERLLKAHAKVGDFLQGTPAGIAEAIDQPIAEKLGSRIGPYKLREQLGEGGMGVVYVAEQTEPVKRKVALKVIKPGMDTRQVITRFEAERQALAMMDHPNIARVFDSGATDSGQPYFVMELVCGVPITEYCDEHTLSTNERLQIFLKVCRAVQHAHQKGVIHRDLKPSNVLVASIDGEAVPKVIDFGVAKAAGPKLTEETVYTQISQLVGTPPYMSPEQVELGVADIDTRSDIYSLGVLLYELLTGNTPFDSETLKQAGFDEMRRIIREDEPPRPSARVSTLKAEALSTFSAMRRSDPRRLSGELQGELDWLVMKALEKNRSRRYESASALAADIQRYLSGEPLEARPTSRLYRIAKYTRRHRALVASVTAILVALGIGLVLATAGYITAERRLTEVTEERENNRLLAELLKEMYPNRWGGRNQGRQQTVLDSIERISASLGERLRNHPTVEIDVRRTFGNAYAAAGELDKARDHLNAALKLAEREYGPQNELLGEIYADLADLVGSNSSGGAYDYVTTLVHAEKAIAIFAALGRDAPVRAWFAKQHCLSFWPERREEAEAAGRECVRLSGDAVIPRWDLGFLLIKCYRLPEAQLEFEEALRICRAKNAGPAIEATVLSGLGKCHRRQGNIAAAQNAFLEAWHLCQGNYMQSESRGLQIGFELAETHFAAGEIDRAFNQVAHMEDLARSLGQFESLAECLFIRGWMHYQLEDYQTAEQLFGQAMQVAREHVGEDDPRFGWPCAYLAFTLEAQPTRAQEAKALYDKLRIAMKREFIDKPVVYETASWHYVRALLGTCGGDDAALDEAERVAQQGLEYVSAWPWPPCEWAFLYELGRIQQRRGSPAAAEKLLREGLEKAPEPLATSIAMRDYLTITRAQLEVTLAGVLRESGSANGLEEAKQVYGEGVVIRTQGLGSDHIQVALAQLRLGEFLAVNYPDDERLRGADQLREAYQKLSVHTSTAVDAARRRAAQRLAELYDTLNQTGEAASWRSTLEQLDQPRESDVVEPKNAGITFRPSAKAPPNQADEI
jgi:serine/threonine protein kinase